MIKSNHLRPPVGESIVAVTFEQLVTVFLHRKRKMDTVTCFATEEFWKNKTVDSMRFKISSGS